MKINNRRYLGNKYKLLSFIRQVVLEECTDVETVFDVFAGTGAVASAFTDRTLITNDLLYSNYLAHISWFSPQEYDAKKLQSIIDEYNGLHNVSEDNYVSQNFANTYFSLENCRKIGFIREDIETKHKSGKINFREYAILITSLLYALDKIANTCGHYDAFRQGVDFHDDFEISLPEIDYEPSSKNKCFNEDSNILAEKISCDLAYLDPPYNSRQYCDCYHLLENLARWEKLPVQGVARKMPRGNLKSKYCTRTAASALEELVQKLNCRYILLSYNNTGKKANDRSNARITDADIKRILSAKGTVKVFEKSYKAFTTGKSDINDNVERLFLCIVHQEQSVPTAEEMIASPLNFTGGKIRLLPQILPLFPQNIDNFVDLFCGGCNVGINVKARNHYYNDIMDCIPKLFMTFMNMPYSCLINDLGKIISHFHLSDSSANSYVFYGCNSSDGLGNFNKEKYGLLKQTFNAMQNEDVQYFEYLFLLIVYGFNNQIRFNRNGEFNLPVGKRDFNINIQDKLRIFLERLKTQKTHFSWTSFDEFDTSVLTQNSLVYCDPPYLIATATYNENGAWTTQNEIGLLSFLDGLNKQNIRFALSNVLTHKGKKNDILLSWISDNGYNVHHLNSNYSNSNYQVKDRQTKSDEVLITNYTAIN